MEEAVTARAAANEAVADIEPQPLRDVITTILDDGSMLPGALTLACARTLHSGVDLDAIAERAAGVQLIYEGLRLTRTLAHAEPWASDTDDFVADLEILAADVLVSRGFALLARSSAAGQAVETVRRFGRDQTLSDGEELDVNLERDIFELAVIAGTSAVGVDAPRALVEFAVTLADRVDAPLPVANDVLSNEIETIARIASASDHDTGVTPPATDP